MLRPPTAHPVGERMMRGPREQARAECDYADADSTCREVIESAVGEAPDGGEQSRRDQWHNHRECGDVHFALVAQRAQVVRVEAPEPLVGLNREREQQRRDRRLDDDVDQHENLHDRIHGVADRRDVGKDRRLAASPIADPEQQYVSSRLNDGQRQDRANEVAARDNAVEPDEEQPGRDGERQEAHEPLPPLTSSVWSKNSVQATRKAPLTSSPTAMLASGIWPAESRWPGVPNGRKFLKNTLANTSPPSPTSP